jgi:hypothetical protein
MPPQLRRQGEVSASRWCLHRIRATFPFLQGYSLSGVWYALRGWGVRLLEALTAAHRHPRQSVVLFLDEMSYQRWRHSSYDWCEQTPAGIPLAVRKPASFRRHRLVD